MSGSLRDEISGVHDINISEGIRARSWAQTDVTRTIIFGRLGSTAAARYPRC